MDDSDFRLFIVLHNGTQDVYQRVIGMRDDSLCQEDDGAYAHEDRVESKQLQCA